MPAGYAPIVVDNGSTDGSGESRARSARGGRASRARVRRGLLAGLAAAAAEVVCFMDCDASLDPRDLPRVAEPVRRRAPTWCSARASPAPGAWPLHARRRTACSPPSSAAAPASPLRDLGPMRAARREPLLELGMRDRRFGWPLEMVLRAAAAGWRIVEVDVPYHPRVGRSKVTGTVRGTVRAVRDMAAVLA